MSVITKKITLRFPMFDRCYGDYILITEEFSKVWREVPAVLSEIKQETDFGLLSITLDWEKHIPMIIENNLKNFYTLEDYLLGKFTEEEFLANNINDNFIDLDCYIKLNNLNNNRRELNERENRIINYYVENILFQIFLAMNLSTPGSFNSYSRELLAEAGLEIYELSSSSIESAWINSINDGWPQISRLELGEVWRWIQSLGLGSRQIAQNRTERALFSILHLCKDGKVNPTQLIWISLALEALYDTPKAQINKILLERIFLFLGIPEDNKKKFKKKIREFYDLRSRFVHGELDIDNPLANNILDNKLYDYESIILEYCDFGLSIVIATLQKMIKNQWVNLVFKESYIGV
jgi:hypothetical protein